MRRISGVIWTCTECLQARPRVLTSKSLLNVCCQVRGLRSATVLLNQQDVPSEEQNAGRRINQEKEQGAMSKRLAEMAEETMDTGSQSDRKMMSDAGFSEDLKKQLEERIAQSAFRAGNPQAFSQAIMPSAAGQGTRQHAAARPWTGTETLEDSALRMLDDSHKKLRTPTRIPRPTMTNLRPAPKKNVSAADRLANARDKTSIYALSQQNDMTEEEREKMRQDLKDRFSPGARPMPTSLQGLTSLANERIEDAIARGQFKNIQRGKGVNTERDYAANSPFLDTTEYFMNKLIQKQEIVPPWIEKQQELIKLVSSFRSRLRNDWRRHAARTIASEGGTVAQQVRKARSYALTEQDVNPLPSKSESVTAIDLTGSLTTITVEEKIAAGIAPDDKEEPEITIKVTETKPGGVSPAHLQNSTIEQSASVETTSNPVAAHLPDSTSTSRILPMPYPFRDRDWERIESAYHNLAIEEINSLARSYNLMAPKVAQKPYYTLSRELNRCFAEVAPTIADEILDRSRKPKLKIEVLGHKEGTVMSKFQGTGHVSKVRDEDVSKGYGFKQFWKDLFRKDERVGHRRGSMV